MRQLIAEFLFSAVLWGSLITWGLWRWRKRVQGSTARKLLSLPLFWFGLHTALAWYGFILPPSGRLVDADSGEPIRNTRVTTAWASYPLSLWTTVCSGEQAHLSGEDGYFFFPLAPLPTLFFGTLYRGQLIQAPGRLIAGRGAISPIPILGTVPISRYKPNSSMSVGVGYWQCEVVIGPGASRDLLPGETHPFEVLYREGCIEMRTWSYNNAFLWDMVRRQSQPRRTRTEHPTPPEIGRLLYEELGNRGCPNVSGVCVYEVNADLHDRFCTHFKSVYDDSWRPQ